MKHATNIIAICLAIFLAGCISLNKGPRNAYNNVVKHDVTFDAIIVPGIPFEGNKWDTVMKGRVLWAYILYKNGITKNIIFSGGAVYSPYTESKIMGLYARALGVPARNIFYDTQARHSTENLVYSYLIAKEQDFKLLALATDPIQSAFLRRFTSDRFGTPIYHLPFVIDSLEKYNHLQPVIDPRPARVNNFTSITTDESRIKRLFGTLGSDIDWKEYKRGVLPPL